MDSRHKLLVILLPLSIASILLAYWMGGALPSVLVGIVICIIAWLSKSVWLPRGHGVTLIRRLSIGIISLIIGTYWLWDNLWQSILIGPILEYLKQQGLNVPAIEGINPMPIEVLGFALMGIFIVNYFMRDNTAMRKAEPVKDEEFPEMGFKQRLEKFAKGLRYTLDSIDHDLDWSDDYFVPLQAEVEVKTRTGKKKKITDLMKALKDNNAEKVLLVLGDPGSGKSVALRKLAKDLTDEVKKTEKVPVYVNLREWSYNEEPSNLKPEDLRSFLFNNVWNRCDVSGRDFMEAYFDKMIEHGRIFFILDSFDEIPFIMDEDESSPAVDHMSAIIYQFLEISNGTRGLLASRLFRKPTRKFMASTTLDIRPLSEIQIIRRFEQSPSYDQRLSELLFKHKPEYIPLARNPFMVSLIYSYAKNNDWTLPEARINLYEDYLKSQFERAKKYSEVEELLQYESLIHLSSEVASFMYGSDHYGLEVPVEDLKLRFPDQPIDAYIELMQSIRLARLGRGERKLFSFAHRRFYEFFIAIRLKAHDELVDMEAIPTDSKWRDALVLYCEVATDEEAKRIANYCWKIIQEIPGDDEEQEEKKGYLRPIHTLRFLNDAFRSRRVALEDFIDELGQLLIERFSNGDLLIQKLIAESTGILSNQHSEAVLINAINSGNSWINETAMRSCRYEAQPSSILIDEVKVSIFLYESPLRYDQINQHIYSYGLADGFKSILFYLRWLKIEKYCFIAVIIAAFFFNWPAAIAMSLITILLESQRYRRSSAFNKLIPTLVFLSTMIGSLFSSEGAEPFDYPIYLLAFIISMPWSQIFYKGHIRKRAALELKLVLYVLSYTLVVPIVEYLEKHMFILFITLIGIAVISMAILLVAIAYTTLPGIIKDLKSLRKTSIKPLITRQNISNMLDTLKSPYGRRIFVQKLDEGNVTAQGEWPSGKLPNYEDKASTHLAQLEERWLGFDR